MSQILCEGLSEKTVFRYFCSIYAFRSRLAPRRTKKNLFPKGFYPWKYLISIPGLNFHFLETSFSWYFKNWFFSHDFRKTAISASQTVDKTEKARNNEIKILV